MTNREFFVAIASNTNLTADLREHAQAQVDKMDASNAKNRGKESKTYKANLPLMAEVLELLAEKLAQELGVTPQPLLKKIRDNPAQSGIVGQAERRANVLGVYQVLNPEQLQGKRVLLLDDIITTGATAGECARVLLTAGAKEVHFAVIAAARQHKKADR